MTLAERIIAIVAGTITIAVSLAALLGKLRPAVLTFAPTPLQATAFAIIAITGTWSFLFWLQLRLSFNYARNHSE